jgi:hypothetical protein
MKIGDLVEYEKDTHWGIGIVVGFVDSGFPNCYPWAKVYFCKWNCTNQSPVNYLRRITK